MGHVVATHAKRALFNHEDSIHIATHCEANCGCNVPRRGRLVEGTKAVQLVGVVWSAEGVACLNASQAVAARPTARRPSNSRQAVLGWHSKGWCHVAARKACHEARHVVTSTGKIQCKHTHTHTHHKVCQLALGGASSLATHLKSSDRHMTVSAGPDEVMAIGRRGGFSDTSTSMLAVACSHNDTHELSLALHSTLRPRATPHLLELPTGEVIVRQVHQRQTHLAPRCQCAQTRAAGAPAGPLAAPEAG